jgi:CheY-like chemotaxis protein/two-component sensor histidine kinase
LSKIEAGKMELVPIRYEIASLISDVMQLNFVYNGSKRIEFELGIDENIPYELIGDELRIKQILNNLLSNAFKYTEKGSIKLQVSIERSKDSDDATLIFSISDTGYGMTEEQMHKIFDEYSRFNLTNDHSIEGTGLGMSIVQNLVNIMNGRISVESEIGKGSVFTVYLPQKIYGTSVLGKEITENLQKFRVSNSRQKKGQIVYDSMPYGNILVVDDVETNIYIMQGLLAPYELPVDTARSGFETINKIKNGKVYDLIFMDHMMPKMDGIEAVKIIRDMGYANPIVALTANAVVGQTEVFLNNGFDGFISKPVDSRQLNIFLKRFVRDKQSSEVIKEANERKSETVPGFKFDNNAMLAIFARDVKRIVPEMSAVLENIKEASEEDLHLFAVNAHAMKSALANIGEKEVSGLATLLEKAGKTGDRVTIKSNTREFLNMLKKIILHVESEAEKKEANTDENPDYLREQLKSISTACANYDKKAAKTALRSLMKMSWTKGTKALIDEISEYLLHSDFEKARKLAEKY